MDPIALAMLRVDSRKPGLGRKVGRLILVLGILLLFVGEASSVCNRLRLRNLDRRVVWAGASSTGYEVFDLATTVQSVSFNVRKRGPDGCNFFVAATTGTGSAFSRVLTRGGETLDYNLYTTSGLTSVLKDIPTALSSEVINATVTTAGNVTIPLSYHWNIGAGQIVAPGNYRDTVIFRLYQGTVGSSTLEDTKAVRFRARVQQVAQLSLVDSSQPFSVSDTTQSLDFGELVEGEILGFDLMVRANTGYDIAFSSDNRGVLAIVGAPGDGSQVPYTFTLAGSPVNLSPAATTVVGPTSATSSAGERYATAVEIGAIGNASAGTYSDNITVTVSSK